MTSQTTFLYSNDPPPHSQEQLMERDQHITKLQDALQSEREKVRRNKFVRVCVHGEQIVSIQETFSRFLMFALPLKQHFRTWSNANLPCGQ